MLFVMDSAAIRNLWKFALGPPSSKRSSATICAKINRRRLIALDMTALGMGIGGVKIFLRQLEFGTLLAIGIVFAIPTRRGDGNNLR
jgi:hypothetical protein